MLEKLQDWDRRLFVFLNNLGIERYDSFWIFVTDPRHWIPLYILFFALFFIAYHWKSSFYLFVLIGFGFYNLGFYQSGQGFFTRLRPNNNPDLSDLIRVLQEPTNYSFFSGHSSTSFCATTFVVLALREKYPWIFIAYLWPIIFVLSRIYVGVHYPGDILVGMIVGISFAFLFYRIYLKSGRRLY